MKKLIIPTLAVVAALGIGASARIATSHADTQPNVIIDGKLIPGGNTIVQPTATPDPAPEVTPVPVTNTPTEPQTPGVTGDFDSAEDVPPAPSASPTPTASPIPANTRQAQRDAMQKLQDLDPNGSTAIQPNLHV